MSLADLAALGGFVSGIGVLISLLLLVFQLRQVRSQIYQAERNQQAAIQQQRYSMTVAVNLATAETGIATAIAKGMAGRRDMTLTELSQFRSHWVARLQISEDTFLQHKAGLLTDQAFEPFVNAVVDAIQLPAVRVMWKRARPVHSADFVAFVDALIAKTPRSAPPDLLAQWNADLALEETATLPQGTPS